MVVKDCIPFSWPDESGILIVVLSEELFLNKKALTSSSNPYKHIACFILSIPVLINLSRADFCAPVSHLTGQTTVFLAPIAAK